ncbi:MAG: methylamine methyltransferase corrinoid protein reductive activase [Candidatus Methanomethylophilaceae archaeon]
MVYGIALDLGTSGFRTHLVDLDKNAKIVSTAITMRHPLPGANIMDHLHFWIGAGSEVGHKIIRQTIDELVKLHAVDFKDVKKISVCGNPIQLSLFENIEVRDLAYAGKNKLKALGVVSPDRRGHITDAATIGLTALDPETEVIIPPAIRHEIGADALAMIIKSGLLDKKETCMVTDYGTNAEMGLFHDGELYSGSAAAGPAMEGQAVEFGMLAAPHALSDVDLDTDGMWKNIVLDDLLRPVLAAKVDPITGRMERLAPLQAIGITGTGVVSAMAVGIESGVVKLPNIDTPDRLIHLMDGINFNEHDILEAGKAMGAIRAGHRTLIHEVGIPDDAVKTMYMAGASGTYVDALKAQMCGMIPRSLDNVYQLGNTSLMMAHDLLRDEGTLDMMQGVADSISANHIMFATCPTFEAMYVLEIAFWLEGMSLEMYNEMIQMSGIAPLPPLKVPSKVVRIVKSDIPDIGEHGLKTLGEVGVHLIGTFEGCIGCRKCERECPEQAINIVDLEDDEHLIRVATDRCLGTACKHCEMTCPEKVYVFNELIVEDKR